MSNNMSDVPLGPHGYGCDCKPPSFRVRWPDLLVYGSTVAVSLAQTVMVCLDGLDDMARAHANWHRERATFTESIEQDLDRLL